MPSVAMEGIRKLYPSSGALANDGVDLFVRDGEIHALVGENGAGKSTLMRILYGLEAADEGRLSLASRRVSIPNPRAANGHGIGMVQQHFTTILDFTVADNVVLGREPRRGAFFIDRRRAAREVAAIIEANGFRLDPSALASALTIGERQQLEIVKLLYRRSELLILDEPTAVLAEQEIHALFSTLRRLRDSGKTVILITHKVREVMEIADSVTVLRRGRSVARLAICETDESSLAALMMGDAPPPIGADRRPVSRPGSTVLSMRGVSLRSKGRARPLVDGVSLSVRSGEVLGLCGVVGNGLGEFENLVSGFSRPSSGRILLEGRPLGPRRSPRLGYVPGDRMRRGACLEATVLDNLASLDRDAYFPGGFIRRREARLRAQRGLEDFSIAATLDSPMSSLSGGNIQKVVLCRELECDSAFLLFSNPTWGLDLASTRFVHERILAARSRGAAILLISANLDEVLSLADRVAVMCRGRIVYEEANGGAGGSGLEAGPSRELLGEYMLGLRSDLGESVPSRPDGGADHG